MLVIWDVSSGKSTFTTTQLTGPAAYSPQGTYKQCYLAYQSLLAACQNQQSALVFPTSSLDAPITSFDSGSMSALAFAPGSESLALALVTATPPRELVMYQAIIHNTCAQNDNPNTIISYERIDPSDPMYSSLDGLSTPWGPGGGYLLGADLPNTVVIKGTWGEYEMYHSVAVVAAALCPAKQSLPADAHPDGWYTVIGYIATADSDGIVRVWGNDQNYLIAMRTAQPVRQLAWSNDGNFLAVVLADGTAQVWQADLSSIPPIWRNTSFN
jgi:WD40 repeat protein